MRPRHKRLLVWAACIFAGLIFVLWTLSFGIPVAVTVPGYFFTLNVHSADFTALLHRGRLYSGLRGCSPFVWKADREVELFGYEIDPQNFRVVLFDRRTGTRIVSTPVNGYFFASGLGCDLNPTRYELKRDGTSRLTVRYSESKGGAGSIELTFDLESKRLIDERRTFGP